MDLASLIGTVVVVTVSGALAPGPLFFTTVSHGTKSGARGGLGFAIGHTFFEMPLVFALALGLSTLAKESIIRVIVAVAGSVALFVFGILQIHDALFNKTADMNSQEKTKTVKSPILLGIVFTGLNPFFIFWWLTIGAELVLEAVTYASLIGVLIIYVAHVWMDYAWLIGVAYLAKIGVKFVGSKGYRFLVTIFGIALIFFGIIFLTSIS